MLIFSFNMGGHLYVSSQSENLYDEEKKGKPTAAKGGEWEAVQQNVKLIEDGEGGNGGYGVVH